MNIEEKHNKTPDDDDNDNDNEAEKLKSSKSDRKHSIKKSKKGSHHHKSEKENSHKADESRSSPRSRGFKKSKRKQHHHKPREEKVGSLSELQQEPVLVSVDETKESKLVQVGSHEDPEMGPLLVEEQVVKSTAAARRGSKGKKSKRKHEHHHKSRVGKDVSSPELPEDPVLVVSEEETKKSTLMVGRDEGSEVEEVWDVENPKEDSSANKQQEVDDANQNDEPVVVSKNETKSNLVVGAHEDEADQEDSFAKLIEDLEKIEGKQPKEKSKRSVKEDPLPVARATPAVNVAGHGRTAASYRDENRVGNGAATASMVCGIIGLFIFGVVLGTLAIILGCIAIGQIDKEPEKYKSNAKCQANAGLTLGLVGLILWVILVFILFS